MPPKKQLSAATPAKDAGSDADFVFESSIGTITVPSLATTPKPNQFKLLRLQKTDKTGVLATDYLLEIAIGREKMEEFEDLEGDESATFMEQWAEHSGVSLGGS
jgi:hypothetical protein